MGLIAKVKKSVGLVKNKAATALGGITKGKISGIVKGTASKLTKPGLIGVAGGIIGFAKKKNIPITPVGAVRKIFTGSTYGKSSSTVTKKSSLGKKIAVGAAVAAGAATIGYAVEQLAEKVGVRGGAGFIGKRRTRRKKGRYAYIRVRRNRRGKGKLTKTEERRLRSTAKRYASSEGTSRRSRRKKGKRGSKSYMAWVRSHRRKK